MHKYARSTRCERPLDRNLTPKIQIIRCATLSQNQCHKLHYGRVASPCAALHVVLVQCSPVVQEELAMLWRHCFPTEEWSPGPHNRWKDAGFQNNKPESDFRGGGIYSLKNLNYMAEHHSSTFQQLLWKSIGQRAELEYPFCAAGVLR